MTVLVGDIGATNARFALVSNGNGRLSMHDEATLPSSCFSSFRDALGAFVERCPEATDSDAACFGLPGPVRNGHCEATNVPWLVDCGSLERAFGLGRVHLLNDLEAAAWGLTVVEEANLRTLQAGSDQVGGNRALLGAGTGLGEAGLVWTGDGYLPFATEGGHADFAPADELQVALWRFLGGRHGHVSWERVLSGPGLEATFSFLLEYHGLPAPDWLERASEGGDAPREITRRSRTGDCPVCREAVELFFSALGAEAGNLALKVMATGGVYLTGSIINELYGELANSSFLAAFTAKGRHSGVVATMPVRVVLDDRLALWGCAASIARQHEPEVAVPENA